MSVCDVRGGRACVHVQAIVAAAIVTGVAPVVGNAASDAVRPWPSDRRSLRPFRGPSALLNVEHFSTTSPQGTVHEELIVFDSFVSVHLEASW